MKRSIRTCCAVLALLLAAPALAQEDALKRAFEAGGGDAAAGIVEASEDAVTAGPQAITAGDDGEVYLLDQINNRVLRFEPDDPNKPSQIITLPDGLEPTDIIVRDGKVLLWDGEIHEMEITGNADAPTRGLTRTRSVAPPDEFASTAFRAFAKGSDLAPAGPSQIFSFLDAGPDSLCFSAFVVAMGDTGLFYHLPSAQHGGSGNVAFADGHVESHRWLSPDTVAASLADGANHFRYFPGMPWPFGAKRSE